MERPLTVGRVRTVELPVGSVSTIYESPAGDVWIGGSNGLARVSGDRAVAITRRNGFPADVFSMVLVMVVLVGLGVIDVAFQSSPRMPTLGISGKPETTPAWL